MFTAIKFIKFCVLSLLLISCTKKPIADSLTIYTYDSMMGKGSYGEWLSETFKKQTGKTIRWVTFGSAGEALNQVLIEGEKTSADILLGVDQNLVAQLPKNRFNSVQWFDQGWLAFNYDSRRIQLPPNLRLQDLATLPSLKKKVVISDPRSSSLGLSFLYWTRTAFTPKEAEKFWKDFSKQLVTISPGWSQAYGLFLKHEAEVVLSYTSSPAYQIENEKNDSFKAYLFSDGNFRQTEGAAVVQSSARRSLAESFVALLLGPESQKAIPLTQWMFPIHLAPELLPESFRKLPAVTKSVELTRSISEEEKNAWIKEWQNWLIK